MIIILDNTFDERYKFNDVTYLQKKRYQDVCKVYSKPTMKNFREILGILDKCEVFCNHRSMRLYNHEGKLIDGTKAVKNFYIKVDNREIPRVEFGRDMHNNFSLLKLDKNLFYSNLKVFLNHYISSQKTELKILFFGENYLEIERLTFFNKVMDEINVTNIKDFKSNKLIIEGIQQLYPNRNPNEMVDEWVKKNLNKKEIRLLINEKL